MTPPEMWVVAQMTYSQRKNSCSTAAVEQPRDTSAAGRQEIGAPAGKVEQRKDPE